MDKSTIHNLIDKVIGKKGLLRIPSWWMRKVLMQIADWVQEGDDANGKKIEKVKKEADGKISTLETTTNNKISTLETNVSTFETNTNSKISTFDSIFIELVDKGTLQHSLKMFSAIGGTVYVDGVKQTIPSDTKTIISFVNTFSFKGDFDINDISYIGLSATDTSAITTMAMMFYRCVSLTSLDLSGLDTSAATSMASMFFSCSGLASLDLSSFDASAVTSMDSMFLFCSGLTSLDLSSFDTSAVTSMSRMFYKCSSLASLGLSSFDTSAVTDIREMFYNCPSLTSLLLGPNFFKGSNVTSVSFSYLAKWTNDTVVTSLVTNSYDRATAGLKTMTLQLSANTKAALTDEQKATITAKGYTIA